MAHNTEKRNARILFYGNLIFFLIFISILLSRAFLTFYKEIGIDDYVLIGSVLGVVFTMLYGLWLGVNKGGFILDV
jgi:hypothetical protein|tara:strand:+ start:447 stop:674 length:228 start_codon:yes stop_codon:yes gene_type:complete